MYYLIVLLSFLVLYMDCITLGDLFNGLSYCSIVFYHMIHVLYYFGGVFSMDYTIVYYCSITVYQATVLLFYFINFNISAQNK